jgi:hypothetical protein
MGGFASPCPPSVFFQKNRPRTNCLHRHRSNCRLKITIFHILYGQNPRNVTRLEKALCIINRGLFALKVDTSCIWIGHSIRKLQPIYCFGHRQCQIHVNLYIFVSSASSTNGTKTCLDSFCSLMCPLHGKNIGFTWSHLLAELHLKITKHTKIENLIFCPYMETRAEIFKKQKFPIDTTWNPTKLWWNQIAHALHVC